MIRACKYILMCLVLQGCVTQRLSNEVNESSINFEVHNNIIIVEAYVNQKWAKFVVDTGASISLLDFNQSKKYRFNYFIDPESRLTGFGGQSKLMKTSDVSFYFKEVDNHHPTFFASDLSGLNRILSQHNQKILGILGSDFLKTNGAIIDYSAQKIGIVNHL